MHRQGGCRGLGPPSSELPLHSQSLSGSAAVVRPSVGSRPCHRPLPPPSSSSLQRMLSDAGTGPLPHAGHRSTSHPTHSQKPSRRWARRRARRTSREGCLHLPLGRQIVVPSFSFFRARAASCVRRRHRVARAGRAAYPNVVYISGGVGARRAGDADYFCIHPLAIYLGLNQLVHVPVPTPAATQLFVWCLFVSLPLGVNGRDPPYSGTLQRTNF